MFGSTNKLLALLLFAVAIGFIRAENATWFEVGKEAVMNCPVDDEVGDLRLCMWNRLNENGEVTFNLTFVSIDNQEILLHKNYAYIGNIIHECGLLIKKISEADATTWQCMVAFQENNNVHTSNFELLQGVRPTQPVILEADRLTYHMVIGNKSETNNTVNLTCCSENGIPNPKLFFMLGDQIMNETVDNSLAPAKHCIRWDSVTFLFTDNEKNLSCYQTHPIIPDEFEKVSQQLNIFYPPILIDSGNMTGVRDNYIVFSANPGDPDITASVDSDWNETLPVKFHINKVAGQGNFTWNVTWDTTEPLLKLPNDSFTITFSNEYGQLLVNVPLNNSIHACDEKDTFLSRFLALGWSTTWILAGPAIGIFACILMCAVPRVCCGKRKPEVPVNPVRVRNVYPMFY